MHNNYNHQSPSSYCTAPKAIQTFIAPFVSGSAFVIAYGSDVLEKNYISLNQSIPMVMVQCKLAWITS